MTTHQQMRRISDDEIDHLWNCYRAVVQREVDGEPETADAAAALTHLEVLGLANNQRAPALFEAHVRVRREAMKTKAEVELQQKEIEDLQRRVVALDKPVSMAKAKTLEEQVALVETKQHDLKVLKHGIPLAAAARNRAEIKLQDMVKGYPRLLKDLEPTS